MKMDKYICSVIVPVYNGATFLQQCLLSVLDQRDITLESVQLIIYNDASTDNSYAIAASLHARLALSLGDVQLICGSEGPLGVGAARNKACEKSQSRILIFLDADDIMLPYRISRSINALSPLSTPVSQIIGGRFDRIPKGSTPRYQQYHARLRTCDLFAHAFRDAPLAFPTVACRKEVWERVRFKNGTGIPEDLHFFFDAMRGGFVMHKLMGDSITLYRFHDGMTSRSLHRRTLLKVRVAAFEDIVLSLPAWREGFSIWGAGRDGKEVYKCLSETAKHLVTMWGDVNPNKIGKSLRHKPIVHFSDLKAPIACCVTLDREGRQFEANLASLNLTQGHDYIHLV